jgi:hypothetical protein
MYSSIWNVVINKLEILCFHNGEVGASVLPAYCIATLKDWSATFRDGVVVLLLRVECPVLYKTFDRRRQDHYVVSTVRESNIHWRGAISQKNGDRKSLQIFSSFFAHSEPRMLLKNEPSQHGAIINTYFIITVTCFGHKMTIIWETSLRFLISDFRRVLKLVCFLLGISPASD